MAGERGGGNSAHTRRARADQRTAGSVCGRFERGISKVGKIPHARAQPEAATWPLRIERRARRTHVGQWGSSGSSHSAEQPKPAECRDAVGRRRAALSQDLARLGRRGPPAALARPLPTRSAESTKRSTSAVGGRRVWSQLTSPPSRGSPCSSCQRRLNERERARCAPHRAVGDVIR